MTSPVPVAVVGPTATGKSELALDLAERWGGEIVNIDAMQLYRGMDIGTAKLAPHERRGIVHHQLDVLDVTETATVANYQRAAVRDVEAIAARGAVPIVVGGSMMYVQSLLDEWSFPATDPSVRARWEAVLAEHGVAAVHAELSRVDPDAAASILPTDGRRLVRASRSSKLPVGRSRRLRPASVNHAGAQELSVSTGTPRNSINASDSGPS